MPLEKTWSLLFSTRYIVRQNGFFSLDMATDLEEGKLKHWGKRKETYQDIREMYKLDEHEIQFEVVLHIQKKVCLLIDFNGMSTCLEVFYS